jgi:hypothetical protein
VKKIWLGLILAGAAHSLTFGYGRSGHLATPTFLNGGDTAEGISATISSSSATLVYDSTASGFEDREVLLQNTDSTYSVYCGTSTAITATTGNRFVLPPFPAGNLTTNGHYDIYCIGGAGAPSIEILGIKEYDLGD